MADAGPAPLTARYVRRRAVLGAAVVFALLVVWALHHVIVLRGAATSGRPGLACLYVILFVFLVWQLFYSYLERPLQPTPGQRRRLDELKVAVIVPLYNEDPQIVRDSVESLLRQTRKLHAISITDDGSPQFDYAETRRWFLRATAAAGVRGHWTRQKNAGKRHAQAAAVRLVPDADILALVDSDTVLDPKATEEGLKPFADPQIQSVAAMVAAANVRQNLFTRVMDLWYVSLQFSDRSVMSRFRSVLVNYGALAFYRAEIVTDNLGGYLSERFFGSEMRISDDSLLTLYALLRGKTVQQITCWAFTYMPTSFRHHRNQQIRWMRGSFIRSWWRFRYLPVARFAFWGHLAKWIQYVVASVATVGVFLTYDLTDPATIVLLFVIQFGIYYGVMLRYLTLRRSDETTRYQIRTFLMAPIAVLWATTFLRGCRIWAMMTCWNMEWGTRRKVEVVSTGGAR
ncbi:glycosyltransferase [Actinoplanes sp. NPDC049118]|uniref:glycosyltransferase n=1 Tax=Actinoplanes sp. NPDC049118 TaxID=3155769 RepID=UPI0033CFCFBC